MLKVFVIHLFILSEKSESCNFDSGCTTACNHPFNHVASRHHYNAERRHRYSLSFLYEIIVWISGKSLNLNFVAKVNTEKGWTDCRNPGARWSYPHFTLPHPPCSMITPSNQIWWNVFHTSMNGTVRKGFKKKSLTHNPIECFTFALRNCFSF